MVLLVAGLVLALAGCSFLNHTLVQFVSSLLVLSLFFPAYRVSVFSF